MSLARSPSRHGALDAVRGLALLGSAVGTALVWLGGRRLGPGFRPAEAAPLDRVVDGVTGLLVDNRVLPVFALLLGYGLAVRTGRRAPAGLPRHAPPEAAEWADALRRAGLLLGLGALHASLLLEADVLGTLGVLLVLGVPLVRARTRTHVAVVVLAVPALLLHGLLDGFGGSAGFPDPPTDYLLSVVDRVGTWLLALVLLLPAQGGLLVAVVLGVRLARSGWVAHPQEHRRGLLLLGGGGTVVGLLGAVPYARLLSADGMTAVAVSLRAGVLDSLTGPVGALGVVCLGALAVGTVGTPSRSPAGLRLPAALGLLGRWSLPVYLAHSAVLALVLAPWALGLGTRWGSAAVTGLGAGVWLLSLAAVVLLGGLVTARSGTAATPASGTARASASVTGAAQPSERQGRERSSAT